jgi:hypothetical protein
MTALAARSPFFTEWQNPVRGRASPWRLISSVAAPTAAAFDLFRDADWVQPTLAAFQRLLALPENWDAHGGKRIRPENVQFAYQLLAQTLHPDTPAPQVVPLSHGGLQLEWHQKGIDLEVEVIRPNEVYASFEDHRITGRDFDVALTVEFSVLAEPIRLLTLR